MDTRYIAKYAVYPVKEKGEKLVKMNIISNNNKSRYGRGMLLAATHHVRKIRRERIWKVQSQTTRGKYYTVIEKDSGLECDCPDFEYSGVVCKHVFAIIIQETKIA